jgi:hypothetical protein
MKNFKREEVYQEHAVGRKSSLMVRCAKNEEYDPRLGGGNSRKVDPVSTPDLINDRIA